METANEQDVQRTIESLTQKTQDNPDFRARLESEPEAALQAEGISEAQVESAVSYLGAGPEVEGHGFNRKSILAAALAAAILGGGLVPGAQAGENDSSPGPSISDRTDGGSPPPVANEHPGQVTVGEADDQD